MEVGEIAKTYNRSERIILKSNKLIFQWAFIQASATFADDLHDPRAAVLILCYLAAQRMSMSRLRSLGDDAPNKKKARPDITSRKNLERRRCDSLKF